jgi:hypothetical protein
MGRRVAVLLTVFGLTASPAWGQDAPLRQPFSIGEALTYKVRIGSLASGSGELRVEGPEAVRGRDTYLLRLDVRGGFGPFRMEGRTSSWLDPETMAAVRFQKEERSPLGTSRESVELFPSQGVWEGADGSGGKMPTRLPLDELSFLFYIRTLPLPDGAQYGVERHFDPARNPVIITVAGRERIEVPAGTFDVIVVEMRVPEGAHVPDGGIIRLYLTDDAWRVPVRIESSVRVLGRVVFTLESSNRGTVAVGGR